MGRHLVLAKLERTIPVSEKFETVGLGLVKTEGDGMLLLCSFIEDPLLMQSFPEDITMNKDKGLGLMSIREEGSRTLAKTKVKEEMRVCGRCLLGASGRYRDWWVNAWGSTERWWRGAEMCLQSCICHG